MYILTSVTQFLCNQDQHSDIEQKVILSKCLGPFNDSNFS